MRISVIGCGYLGAVHAACMAAIGHEVVGIELEPLRLEALRRGTTPFYETGLEELLREGCRSGRLRFSDDPSAAAEATVHFLCVGTPQRPDADGADLSALDAAVTGLLPLLRPGHLVVGKSTVPVGTAVLIARRIRDACAGAELAWNPEFLRESTAVQDTLHPDRLVYGVERGTDAAVRTLDAVYAPLLADRVPRLVTDFATAELVKVAANSFLATKISFINAMSEVCDRTGGNVDTLADALGMDARIGRAFLNAGMGYGGGCLPKDVRAFRARTGELGADGATGLLDAVDVINARTRAGIVGTAAQMLGGSVVGRRVTVLGASFKPVSDDVRDAPGLAAAEELQAAGALVTVTDPQGCANARRAHPQLAVEEDLATALDGAELVLLATAWEQYVQLDPQWAGALVAQRRVLDGQGALDGDAWRDAGWQVQAPGRTSGGAERHASPRFADVTSVR
jgi:UDPglucose 6-dehydrogenase